jgi:hypothetical protein
MSSQYPSIQLRFLERDTAISMANVTIAAAMTKMTPPTTIVAALNPPIKTVMAIQMKPAMKPASSALMVRERLERAEREDMVSPKRNGQSVVGEFTLTVGREPRETMRAWKMRRSAG